MTSDLEKPAILVQQLLHTFRGDPAVDRLDLSIKRGEIFGLIGPDGAGKTTVMRILCGLIEPTKGVVEVAGLSVRERGVEVRDRVGYMAQRFGLYLDLTVEENMHFYSELFGLSPSVRDPLMTRLLTLTRMTPFRDRRAGQLSGGMKQKLALICSLLHEPEILILDEPTNGVDPISRRDFWGILHQLARKGMTILVSTSYLDEAERCSRVGLIYRGRMLVCDIPQALSQYVAEPCYSLRVSKNQQARSYLKTRRDVVSVEPAGQVLHLFLSSGTEGIEEIRTELASRQIEVFEFIEVAPTVEDVFIALIQKQEERAA